MNYETIHTELIRRAAVRTTDPSVFYEKHHVLPRCLGGDDNEANLVLLTPKEHRLAHKLLVKLHPGNSKLIFAANMMYMGRDGVSPDWLRAQVAEKRKAMWSDPTIRQRLVAGAITGWQNEERKAANSKRMTSYWSNEAARQGNREKLKAYWAAGGHSFSHGALTVDQQKEVCRRYIAGETQRALCEEFGVSNRCLLDAIQKFHPTKKYKSKTFSTDEVDEMRRLREVENKSWSELGRIFNKPSSTVRRAVKFSA